MHVAACGSSRTLLAPGLQMGPAMATCAPTVPGRLSATASSPDTAPPPPRHLFLLPASSRPSPAHLPPTSLAPHIPPTDVLRKVVELATAAVPPSAGTSPAALAAAAAAEAAATAEAVSGGHPLHAHHPHPLAQGGGQ